MSKDPLQDAINATPKTPGATWYGRDVCPPPAAECPLIWASDGELVWPIVNDGRPVSPHALLVLYWTAAFVPAPPGKGGVA